MLTCSSLAAPPGPEAHQHRLNRAARSLSLPLDCLLRFLYFLSLSIVDLYSPAVSPLGEK